MNAAERLRQGMTQNAPFSKKEFIDVICRGIKQSGMKAFICDRHINKTKIHDCLPTIRMADEVVAVDFARSEGFTVSYSSNSYGVRYMVFTL